MVTARHIELVVALRPFVERHIEIRRVLREGAEVWLETDALGRGNWALKGEAEAPAAEAAPTGTPLVIDLARIDIRDSVLTWHD